MANEFVSSMARAKRPWTAPTNPTAFDTDRDCSAMLGRMSSLGFDTAIRYYDHTVLSGEVSGKCLKAAETTALIAAGFSIVAVYEASTNVAKFDAASGEQAGERAARYAQEKIKQPLDSAIYFAADFDPNDGQIEKHIIPFLQGARKGMGKGSKGGIPYSIGVYGSGLTCAKCLVAGVADYFWLANATGWQGYADFNVLGRWHLKQQHTKHMKRPTFDYDPNYVGAADIGSFSERHQG